MKLFLDDTCEFPKTGYECVRDAKTLLSVLEFDFITLDYSLGKCEENGLDVLVWMKENKIHVPHINIHSNHIFGRQAMKEFCQEYFPNTITTMNMLPK